MMQLHPSTQKYGENAGHCFRMFKPFSRNQAETRPLSTDRNAMNATQITEPSMTPEMWAITIATHAETPSFSAKVDALYAMTENLIHDVEKKYKTKIRKCWGKEASVMDTESINDRIRLLHHFKPHEDGPVIVMYRDTLNILKTLQNGLTDSITRNGSTKHTDDIKQNISCFLQKEKYDGRDLDQVISRILTLQIHAWHLHSKLKSSQPNISKQTSINRASAGGKARNRDGHILMQMVGSHLKQLRQQSPKKTFVNIEALYSKELPELHTIMDRYKDEQKNNEAGKSPTAYRSLKAENMLKTMISWAEEDDEFYTDIKALVPSHERERT
jgi:hypothetical protein